jgi:prepilin-type N-terminal cleavage/methylation domain-containing protein/prepilin-type processing-associated H-X9-DG protein
MHKQHGFTLIELLVVIAIIVLLMAILMPTLQRVRNQARAAVCQANLKQWGTTLALYIEDSQGYLPFPSGYISILRGLSLSNDDPNGPEPLNPVDTKGIVFCPMAIRSGREVPRTFRAWEITLHGFRGSYGFNRQLFGLLFDRSIHTDKGTPDIFSLSGRANIPTLLDATRHQSSPVDRFRPPSLEAFGTGWGTFCINRHNGHVNSLFLDWSVRKVGLKELWTLKWYSEFDTAGPWTKAGGVQPEDWPEWMRKFKDY